MGYLMLIFVFIFGLIIGSFLNALIWRMHSGETMWDRSRCPKCKHQLAWYDNIPLLGYVFLGGKCRHCKKNISIQYPLVELITGALFAIAFSQTAGVYMEMGREFLGLARDWFVIAVMIIIFVYDLRWYMILDKVTVPAFIILAGLNLYLGMSWQNMLVSVIIGGSFFLLQFIVSKGKWIGGGDIRLGALMGVILGWPQILTALFLAYITGSAVGLSLIALGKKHMGSKVPFGTFLSIATIIVLFWGEQLVNWYFNLFTY